MSGDASPQQGDLFRTFVQLVESATVTANLFAPVCLEQAGELLEKVKELKQVELSVLKVYIGLAKTICKKGGEHMKDVVEELGTLQNRISAPAAPSGPSASSSSSSRAQVSPAVHVGANSGFMCAGNMDVSGTVSISVLPKVDQKKVNEARNRTIMDANELSRVQDLFKDITGSSLCDRLVARVLSDEEKKKNVLRFAQCWSEYAQPLTRS
jgi:hypothetical protein